MNAPAKRSSPAVISLLMREEHPPGHALLTNNTLMADDEDEVGQYFIIHLDVYQGKNAANIGIPEEIHHLPTTQKAVVNAIIASGIGKDPDGMRCLYLDNRYTCAQLLVLIRDLFDILGSGTTRKNRIGWPGEQLNMTKSAERGANMVVYDKKNGILCTQWMDNKVVQYTSTLGMSGLTSVSRRSGATIIELQVEKALQMYQKYMDGVDRGDQIREIGAGFARKAHYKKWYKRAYFAVLDFMMLNGMFSWNMPVVSEPSLGRLKLKKWQFHAAVATEMMNFVDDGHQGEEDSESEDDGDVVRAHLPELITAGKQIYCQVCKLEEKWRKDAGFRDARGHSSRTQRSLAGCACRGCNVRAHCMKVQSERMIFDIPTLRGLTCFEIAHSETCWGLWSNLRGPRATKKFGRGQKGYSVSTSHPV